MEAGAWGPAETLWTPSPERVASSRLHAYMGWLEADRGLRFDGYESLRRWSTVELDGFWGSIWDYFQVQARHPYGSVLAERRMPGARWFSAARLNYVDHALRAAPDALALIARSETRAEIRLTYGELREAVGAAAAGLRSLGVGPGDRVAAYVPNIPETVVAFLATASLGAVWSSCAPEFGVGSVIDRFAQIGPKVLIAADGYVHAGRRFDRMETVAAIEARLPTVERTVLIPHLDPRPPTGGLRAAVTWEALLSGSGPPESEAVAFDHPLWVLYSSGTTGLPKAIVQGHGGILLEHMKAVALHKDVGPGDRFFWQTTTGWMMWNLLLGGLLVGATVVLWDGSPSHPGLDVLWRMAAEVGVTFFGTSAGFVQACMKAGVEPGRDHDLSRLRTVGSTASPLPPEGFRWLYSAVKEDMMVAPASGGTDLCTAFIGPCPSLPVRAGEMQCRMLGAAIESFSPRGEPLVDEVGELVITEPMPSMPTFLWGDPDGSRLRESYFSSYEGVWRHGDWLRITPAGSCVILGRSDATLNRGGVRMGTAEFYPVVEGLPEVVDSLVIDTSVAGKEGRLLLFVVVAEGAALDAGLRARILAAIREQLSPRHVPDEVHQVPSIPRTLTGKKMEVPVKRILAGEEPRTAASADAMLDPAALGPFVRLAGAPGGGRP
ncbi:MAG: acetoacetate--CoA ligase [Candidatus Dormibacterales bacterium]